MTASASYALAIAALVLGVVLGLLLTRIRRSPGRYETGPSAAVLFQRLVYSSDNGIAILNEFGDQVLHNQRAVALGLVHDHRVDERAADAARRVLRHAESVTVDLSPARPQGRDPVAVRTRLRPLGDGFVAAEAVDHSEAYRLERTRRDFVANVSHELKTPVGAISLLAEAMADAADDSEEARRFSVRIRDESNRLGTLVGELISLSRLQGAEDLPELDEVAVDDVVAGAIERCGLFTRAAGGTVVADGDSGLRVLGDSTLLITALANLLSNAVAYSQADSPVSLSRRLVAGSQGSGPMVEIAVTDRGIGIPAAAQQRVFERFYRVDKARSRATGGTGLGLAIVKHVAANHGGDVRLWSAPGVGSTFTLCIPAYAEQDQAGSAGSDEDHSGAVRAVEDGDAPGEVREGMT